METYTSQSSDHNSDANDSSLMAKSPKSKTTLPEALRSVDKSGLSKFSEPKTKT